MTTDNCIIVGASHAGVSLALQLRKEGWSGRIQLIGAEPELPYHRPPLSKELLGGSKTPEAIQLRPAVVYADNAIELLLNTQVTVIDPVAHTVQLQDGSSVAYTKLALCIGAQVRKLALASAQANIHYIRTLQDATRLSAELGPGKRGVIIGGGYIGLEAAAQLAQKGISVTLLEAAERILHRVTAPVLSDYFTALHAAHGVAIHEGVTVSAITGTQRAEKVICNNGLEIAIDFVIVGIGIVPDTELAVAAGLQVDEGIVVDEYTRTSDPDIHAAGDCTRHPSALYQRALRLESVQNATDQARIAAANICGKALRYDTVPWFWSDQYDIKLQTAGINTGHDTVIHRGEIDNRSGTGFAVFYLRDGRMLAADCVNRPREFMASKQWIRSRAIIDQQRLQDEAIALTV